MWSLSIGPLHLLSHSAAVVTLCCCCQTPGRPWANCQDISTVHALTIGLGRLSGDIYCSCSRPCLGFFIPQKGNSSSWQFLVKLKVELAYKHAVVLCSTHLRDMKTLFVPGIYSNVYRSLYITPRNIYRRSLNR